MSRKFYKKIDIYVNGQYVCSSIWYRTFKQAIEGFKRNPSWVGVRKNNTIGNVTRRINACDSVTAQWSSCQ